MLRLLLLRLLLLDGSSPFSGFLDYEFQFFLGVVDSPSLIQLELSSRVLSGATTTTTRPPVAQHALPLYFVGGWLALASECAFIIAWGRRRRGNGTRWYEW